MKRKIKNRPAIRNKKVKNVSDNDLAKSSLKKQYLKTRPECRVTFMLPKMAAPDAGKVNLAGEFNNWSITETPLKKLKNGDYKITLGLACSREYRFRYVIDGALWENDWYADKYVTNPYGCDDSIVVI